MEGEESERSRTCNTCTHRSTQNALPLWHTHSTVTGSATALGLGKSSSEQESEADARSRRKSRDKAADTERDLLDHYANLEEEDDFEDVGVEDVVKTEPVKVELEDDGAVVEPAADDGPMVMGGSFPFSSRSVNGSLITVAGVAKRVEDITEEDEQLMTEEEHRAFYEVVENM